MNLIIDICFDLTFVSDSWMLFILHMQNTIKSIVSMKFNAFVAILQNKRFQLHQQKRSPEPVYILGEDIT